MPCGSVQLLTELISLSESKKEDYVFIFAKQLQKCEFLLQSNSQVLINKLFQSDCFSAR